MKFFTLICELNSLKEKKGDEKKMEEKTLSEFKTCEIVNELKTREGVTAHWAEPHSDKEVKVSGPARVLIITD